MSFLVRRRDSSVIGSRTRPNIARNNDASGDSRLSEASTLVGGQPPSRAPSVSGGSRRPFASRAQPEPETAASRHSGAGVSRLRFDVPSETSHTRSVASDASTIRARAPSAAGSNASRVSRVQTINTYVPSEHGSVHHAATTTIYRPNESHDRAASGRNSTSRRCSVSQHSVQPSPNNAMVPFDASGRNSLSRRSSLSVQPSDNNAIVPFHPRSRDVPAVPITGGTITAYNASRAIEAPPGMRGVIVPTGRRGSSSAGYVQVRRRQSTTVTVTRSESTVIRRESRGNAALDRRLEDLERRLERLERR